MNIKQRVLSYLYEKNKDFFYKKSFANTMASEVARIEKKSLFQIFEKHREDFEEFIVRDFIGYIPKDVNEPALKIFEDHAELFQKWIMWQSYYVNRKALHDPVRITKYDGMMIYLKVLFLMAEANKKKVNLQALHKPINSDPEAPWLDRAMDGVEFFKDNYGKREDTTNQS